MKRIFYHFLACFVIFCSLLNSNCLSMVEMLEFFDEKPKRFVSGDFFVNVYKGDCTITGYNGTDTEVIVPEYVDGYRVNAINFSTGTVDKMTSITLPSGLDFLLPFSLSHYYDRSIGGTFIFNGEEVIYNGILYPALSYITGQVFAFHEGNPPSGKTLAISSITGKSSTSTSFYRQMQWYVTPGEYDIEIEYKRAVGRGPSTRVIRGNYKFESVHFKGGKTYEIIDLSPDELQILNEITLARFALRDPYVTMTLAIREEKKQF